MVGPLYLIMTKFHLDAIILNGNEIRLVIFITSYSNERNIESAAKSNSLFWELYSFTRTGVPVDEIMIVFHERVEPIERIFTNSFKI